MADNQTITTNAALQAENAQLRQRIAQLEQERDTARAILDATPGLVYVYDLDEERVVYTSHEIMTMLGYPAEQVQAWGGAFLAKVLHPDDQPRLGEHFAQFQHTPDDSVLEFECRIQDVTGAWHWFLTRNKLFVRGAAGIPRQIVGSACDITAHKQMAEELTQSWSFLHTLINHLPVAVFAKNTQNTFMLWNKACEVLLGIAATDAIGQTDVDLFPPEQAAAFQREDQAILQQGVVHEVQAEEIVSQSLGPRMFRTTKVPVYDERGKPLWLLGIAEDITERCQAEAVLRASEARYRTLARNMPDAAVLLFDHHLRYTLAEGMLLQQGPVSKENLEGFTIWEAFHPKTSAVFEPAYRAALDGQRRCFVHTFHDRIYQVQTIPIYDDHGRIVAGMDMTQDITERTHAEEVLRFSETHLRLLLSQVPAIVWTVDIDMRLISAQGAGLAMLKLHPDQVIGKTVPEFFQNDAPDAPPIAAHLNAFRGESNSYDLQIGNLVYQVYVEPLRNSDSVVIGAIGIGVDITELKQAENALMAERASLAARIAERTEELSKANAELARALQVKDEFLAVMSHELRTPLNAVIGMSEALQEHLYGLLNPEQHRALATIATSGYHLLSLINDILDYSKIEAGKMHLNLGMIDIETLCQDCLQMIRQEAAHKQIMVTFVHDTRATMLEADPLRLKQILVNLLSNAVKFTSTSGRVGLEIASDAVNQIVTFTVWDTGIGISPNGIKQLFRPFVQIDSRLNREYDGTGLGLVLVARLVEMHRGSVSVLSEVGKGSRFTVTLPWTVSAMPIPATNQLAAHDLAASTPTTTSPTTTPPPTSQPDSTTQPLLLLVDDNEDTLFMLNDYMSRKGYRVMLARNGVEALEQVQAQRPDLVLMDIQMPKMDGIAAIQHIRANPSFADLPIIALTALVMPGDRERCLAAGANEYVSKPVSLKQLLDVIKAYLV